MGHPSGSDGFSRGAGRIGDRHSNTVEKMPRLGRARRKTRPSLEWAFGWLLQYSQSRSRCGKHRSIRCKSGAIQSAFVATFASASRSDSLVSGVEEMSRLGRSQAEKSAQASWGHSVGFDLIPEMSQAWVGQAENPPKPCGDIRLACYVHSFGSVSNFVLRERPGLEWARRKTHSSRTGHSSYSGKAHLSFCCDWCSSISFDLLDFAQRRRGSQFFPSQPFRCGLR